MLHVTDVDSISDMFIRIKNAGKAGHKSVLIPHSKFKNEIVKTLERAKFVGEVEKRGKRVRKSLEVKLSYDNNEPRIRDVKFLSSPSRHIYSGFKEIPKPKYGGVIIVSTSKGVMTADEAKKAKIGGELIAEIW